MNPYQHNSGPALLIGIPTLGRPVPLEWAFAFKSLSTPTNYNCLFHTIKGQPVDVARNEMVKAAREKGCKYIFFLGDDVVVPNHTLRQLIYRMEQDPSVGVVGGVYCCKSEPSDPLVYRGNGQGSYWDWKHGEYFEVTGLGMDCTLIRIEVFNHLVEPFFKTVSTDQYLDSINNAEEWTEDLYFLNQVSTKTTYKIMCDAGIICDHWDVSTGKKYTLPSGSLPTRGKLVTKSLKALTIGEEVVLTDGEAFDVTTYGPFDTADYRGSRSLLPFDNDYFDWVVVGGINRINRDDILEWLRVCKTKLTMTFDRFLDMAKVVSYLAEYNINPKLLKNNMLEVVKEIKVPFEIQTLSLSAGAD